MSSLLQRLARVSLEGLPSAYPTSGTFQSIAPLLLESEDDHLAWPDLERALEACFGSASAIDRQEIKGGGLGFSLVVKAFQKLPEELEDEDEEVERDLWVVNLTSAVKSAVKSIR